MAVRNAIESYKTFVVATSTVNDYKLIKDLIQTISSGYIEDLKTVEETVNGRTIRIIVEGYIAPAVIDKVLTREVERLKGKEPEGVDDNGYVKILNEGQLRTIKFYIPEKTKSYRVWLYKGK